MFRLVECTGHELVDCTGHEGLSGLLGLGGLASFPASLTPLAGVVRSEWLWSGGGGEEAVPVLLPTLSGHLVSVSRDAPSRLLPDKGKKLKMLVHKMNIERRGKFQKADSRIACRQRPAGLVTLDPSPGNLTLLHRDRAAKLSSLQGDRYLAKSFCPRKKGKRKLFISFCHRLNENFVHIANYKDL